MVVRSLWRSGVDGAFVWWPELVARLAGLKA